MNRKRIASHLNRKIERWLQSISDESVRELARKNTIVTGGAMASLLTGEEPHDYDVYFRNQETTEAVAKYYVTKFKESHPTSNPHVVVEGKTEAPIPLEDGQVYIYMKSNGVAGELPVTDDSETDDPFDLDIEESDTEGKPPYRPVYLTCNAITLSDKIQIVVRFYGEVEDIHRNYDYLHCTCSYDHNTGKVELPAGALEAIINKELIYVGSKYPLCSIIRTRKFIERGWKINAGQYVKMIFQLQALDLTNINVLRDQLVGVDSAYFEMVINALQSKSESMKEKGENWSITGSYVCELINRIF